MTRDRGVAFVRQADLAHADASTSFRRVVKRTNRKEAFKNQVDDLLSRQVDGKRVPDQAARTTFDRDLIGVVDARLVLIFLVERSFFSKSALTSKGEGLPRIQRNALLFEGFRRAIGDRQIDVVPAKQESIPDGKAIQR